MKSRPPRRILYWDGIVDLEGLSDEYHVVIQKLLAGEYSLLSLEKLHGYDVYSVRINDTHRMLFTTAVVNGSNQLVILDVVLNHDYHKSRFLKPGVLRNYRELNGKAIEEDVKRQHFETVEKPRHELNEENASEYEFVAAEYYTQHYIEFSKDQNNVVKVACLPVVINGAAGSGKSCVALSLIGHHVVNHVGHAPQRILYITESENLCRSMYSNWVSLPAAHFPEAQCVEFKSYKQLIIDTCPELEKSKQVFEANFLNYMRDRLRIKSVTRAISDFSADIRCVEKIYQEFRIISGYESLKAYQNLGKHQSLYQKNEREWLYSEYQAYLKHLASNNMFDLAFYLPKLHKPYDLIVVDETQDFSHQQIKVLRDLAVNRQICYCEDTRQSLTDNLPKKSFYSTLLDVGQRRTSFVQLPQSYRCPTPVLNMANHVSFLGSRLVKQHFVPTTAHDGTRPGNVIWHDSLTDEELADYCEQAQSPQVAIITRKEYLAEAKAKFKTELVFTIDQIKGLEYRDVIAFRLLDNDVYYEANDILSSKEVVRPGNERFSPAFNAIYTAFTRATENLIIIEDQPEACRKLTYLTTELQKKIPSVYAVKAVQALSAEETLEEWYKQGNYFLQSGDIDRAKEIFVNKLKMTAEEFETHRADYFKAERRPVVVTKATSSSKKKKKANQIVVAANPAYNPNERKSLLGESPEEWLEYVNKLLEEPTFERLASIFEDSDAALILFQAPVTPDSTRCLFDVLLNNPEARQHILPTLLIANFNKLAPHFNDKSINGINDLNLDKMPPLYWMIKEVSTLRLLVKNPHFATIVAKHLQPWALLRANTDTLDYASVFAALTKCEASVKILLQYFQDHPDVAVSIIAEDLGFGENCSPFQFLLYYPNVGIPIINLILDAHPEYAKKITARDIFATTGSAFNPVILSFLHMPLGKAFLRRLQSLNPDLYPSDLTLMTVARAQQANRELNTHTIERKYIESLLGVLNKATDENTIKQNLENLFNNNRANIYLFDVILDDGECLFARLFEIPLVRKVMLNYFLLTRIPFLCEFVTNKALCRLKNGGHMPPIFWICGNEVGTQLMKRLMTHIGTHITALSSESLYATMNAMQYYRADVPHQVNVFNRLDYIPFLNSELSTFHCMLLTEAGRWMLHHMMVSNDFVGGIKKELLTTKQFVDLKKNKERINMLRILSRTNSGIDILGVIMLKQVPLNNIIIDTDMLLDGLTLNEGIYQGECILLNLLKEDNLAVLHIFSYKDAFDLPRIMTVLTQELRQPPNNEKGVFLSLLNDGTIISMFLIFLANNAEIIRDFNKQHFESHDSPYVELLASTDLGIALLQLIRSQLTAPPSPRMFADGDEVSPIVTKNEMTNQ